MAWLGTCLPELLGAAVALLFAGFFLNVVPDPDVGWQLWIAHQIRLGARLYVDIIETNPPLWFWEAVPLDWLSGQFHIPSSALLVALIGAATAVSIWAAGRLTDDINMPRRATLLCYAALTLLLMPLISMGQREQLVLIGMLPYTTLSAARRSGQVVSSTRAVTIAIGAALVLALKHYFLIAPLLVEAWLVGGLRREYKPFRPETLALAAFGILYAAAISLTSPEFLRDIVPLNRLAYSGLGAASVEEMLSPIQGYWLIALLPLTIEWRSVRRSNRASVMVVVSSGFMLAWLIQFKGFPYHAIAVTGFLMLALGFLAIEEWAKLHFLTRAALPTIMLLPLAFAAWYGPFRDDFGKIVRPMLADIPARHSVAFVSDQPIFSWPLQLYRPSLYPSRQSGFWILQAVALDHGRTPALTRLGHRVSEETGHDYACVQPVRIFISRKPIESFDLKYWMMQSPAFAQTMSHYRLIGHRLIFDVYQLKAPFPAPSAGTCRRVFV